MKVSEMFFVMLLFLGIQIMWMVYLEHRTLCPEPKTVIVSESLSLDISSFRKLEDIDYEFEVSTELAIEIEYKEFVALDQTICTPIHEINELEKERDHVWQIAVPNCGTSTLENVLRAGVNQSMSTRFAGNSCFSCNNEEVLASHLFLNSSKWSGGHSDWTRSSFNFQSIEEGGQVVMHFRDPKVYHSKLFYSGMGKQVRFDFAFAEYMGLESIESVELKEYIENSHWRWNLFARGLYGHGLSRNSFIVSSIDDTKGISREEAEVVRMEGLSSDLYQTAIERMKMLSHIGIFERMEESIELLCWTFCWNPEEVPFEFKEKSNASIRPLSPVEDEMFELYHNIDIQLYKDVVALFDQRVAEMRQQKSLGITCNLMRECPFQSK